jgi:hypothetical protein
VHGITFQNYRHPSLAYALVPMIAAPQLARCACYVGFHPTGSKPCFSFSTSGLPTIQDLS